jgi:protein-disulfide isomerase
MRSMIAVVLGAAALVAAAPVKDWRTATGVVAATGAFTVGNPAAKVKLIEYLSFTCPHCADFARDSKAALHDSLVRSGKVAVETRSAARDPYDLAAWMVVRCGGPARFARLSSAVFASQKAWTDKGEAYAQANLPALKAMQERQQLRTLADQSGLSAIGAANGVTAAQLNQCFATDADMNRIIQTTKQAFAKIPGTPAFEINGRLVDGHDWASLAPQLAAAGAK